LEQIARYTQTDGGQEMFLVGFPRDDDGFEGSTICTLDGGNSGEPRYLQRVDDEDIAFGIELVERSCVSIATLSNNEKIGSLAEKPYKGFTQ
jgi:hypothetical protein